MSTNRVISSSVLRKFASLCDCSNSHYTDCFIISTYIKQNHIHVINNALLLNYLIDDDNILLFIDYLDKKKIVLCLEDLIVFFEFVISPQDKEVNGAVYTPKHIREYIVTRVLKQLNGRLDEKKFADIACGCGGFLITLAQHLHSFGITYDKIYRDCLYGVDIAEYSITRARLMLSLLALTEEDVPEYQFNLIQADSLCFDWNTIPSIKKHGGFDSVVGNPPYVGASKIDKKSLELVKQWEVSRTGKADMYIPFFQIGVENLVNNGVLGYITVNNFYRSVNGRALRYYFARNNYDVSIIDFGAEQVFRGRSTYTCLCFVKKMNDGIVHYTQCDNKQIAKIKDNDFVRLSYQDLSCESGWTLSYSKELLLIELIRKTGVPLEKYVTIRNGFATLRNDIYVFTPTHEDDRCYFFETSKGEAVVEKSICREAIKGNILRCEEDLKLHREKLLFPYRTNNNVIVPIEENELKTKYPLAYSYLNRNKEELAARSKSDKICPWYLFGRSQALNISGYKLLFPYIANSPSFILCKDKNIMFYNGYSLADESIEKLQYLQKLLSSRLFWRYIKATSKPYGGDFYALAKNYVKSFGVIELSEEQKNEYMAMPKEDADKYIEKMYGVNI